ncbi:NIPSNAP family protein [Dyadobacter sediminis]|uniref:NIPSNAP family containing protein n=1 Tax=Dyadobacter sediminis TaxID=1493691 RepID=A0A5R9K992_9BACT|nr:NIPSNAP family protein [Dyadobacter sediminis]TLU90621.1 NIPSNAP family containing protein [Dyadobacter sediminis]
MKSCTFPRSRFRLFSLLFILIICKNTAFGFAPKREFYQIKIYHFKEDSQRQRLETYLKDAYLPALHRAGIKKVGVFEPADEKDSLLYVLIPFKSAEQFLSLPQTISKDKQYVTAGRDYIETEYNNPVHAGFESVFMEAFAGMPAFKAPALQSGPSERIYELRRYEAASEKLHENKISQFNNGELAIFSRLGFNVVFCGQVKAGGKMPSLMYMSSFENKAERDAHWKAFGSDPAWTKLNAQPEYAHNFLRADIYLLHPMAFSDI